MNLCSPNPWYKKSCFNPKTTKLKENDSRNTLKEIDNVQVNNFNSSLITKLIHIWVRKHQHTSNLAQKKTLNQQKPTSVSSSPTIGTKGGWGSKYPALWQKIFCTYSLCQRLLSIYPGLHKASHKGAFFFFRKLFQWKYLECSIGDRGLLLRKEET